MTKATYHIPILYLNLWLICSKIVIKPFACLTLSTFFTKNTKCWTNWARESRGNFRVRLLSCWLMEIRMSIGRLMRILWEILGFRILCWKCWEMLSIGHLSKISTNSIEILIPLLKKLKRIRKSFRRSKKFLKERRRK